MQRLILFIVFLLAFQNSGLAALNSTAQTAYFLVASRDEKPEFNDSYVLPVNGEEQIAAVRAELAKPPIERLRVLNEWKDGSDGINKDHYAVGAPLWTWHVSKFLGVMDGLPVFYSGGPTMLEMDRESFRPLNQTFAFPGYVVMRELQSPFRLSATLEKEGAIHLRWQKLNGSFDYELQTKADLTGSSWATIETLRNETNAVVPLHKNAYFRVIVRAVRNE